MINTWTEVFETERQYLKADGSSVVIKNPHAVFISSSGTHYISNEDDTQRLIVPWPFNAISIKVEEAGDWIYPPPREECLSNPQPKTEYSGPWALSDIFKKVQE